MQFFRIMHKPLVYFPRISIGTKCSIFSYKQLQIQEYVDRRQIVCKTLSRNALENQREFLHRKLTKTRIPSDVFISDFLTFIYTIESTPNDLDLLKLAIDKLKFATDRRIDKRVIGLVIMRALYHLENDIVAIEIYRELYSTELFGRTKTILIYFNLLYIKAKYAQIIDDVKLQIQRMDEDQHWRMSRAMCLLIFAACYNENSRESFDYAKHLQNTYGRRFNSRDHLIYLSALALTQNIPSMAEEYLQQLGVVEWSVIPNLLLMAALQRGQLAEALKVIDSVPIHEDDSQGKLYLSMEIIEYAESIFDNQTLPHQQTMHVDFKTTLERLRSNNHIVDRNVDQMLLDITQSEESSERSKLFAKIKRIHKKR